jgi:RNA polymerase sigma factor (sigma-70 family)
MNDAELVARCRHDDAEAFGLLVERHQRLVFAVALARCQDPVLAEDVAQEAFVTAWRDLDRLRDSDRIGSWIAGIARNLAASAARDRRRAAPVVEVSEVPTPQDEAFAREDRALLAHALADVPEAHRETLVLYYLEGRSIAAIANALGIRADLVKQRLSRGRRALRDAVDARLEGALSRARTSPSFRAGVLTAIAAGGARQAKAATAGKVITMMATNKLVLAGTATLMIATGAIWLGTRARADDRTAHAPSTGAASAGTTTAVRNEGTKPMVRKLGSAAERGPLLESIRRAQQQRGASTAATARPTPSLAAGESGDLDKDYVRAAVSELLPMLKECFEQAIERTPGIQGSVVVDFTIEGEPGVGGVVSDSRADPEASQIKDPILHECVAQTLYALEIDPPVGGGTVRVRFPFSLAPGN